MSVSGRNALIISLPWLLLAVLATLVLLFRLQLSFDLGLFFPRGSDTAQQVLLQQLSSGPGSRLILVGLQGETRATLEEVSSRLKAELQKQPQFLQVQNGEMPEDLSAAPATVSRYRFLLSDPDFSAGGLRHALENRLQDLAFGSGNELVELIAADPYLSMPNVLEQLAPGQLSGDPWFSADGSAVLMAETKAPATDIAAQQQAIDAIRASVEELSAGQVTGLEVTGVGAFGVELQHTIRAEAQWRSSLAVAALLLVLFIAYRSPLLLLLGGLPLGLGFLTGLATVAAVFDQVHGITLAFGFTLLGIAIDFPLHLFSHARGSKPTRAMTLIWPTMRIGAASTLLAYSAITMAGSSGLAQLGLFTASGLVAAVAVTRFWLPHLMPDLAGTDPGESEAPAKPNLNMAVPIVTFIAAVALIQLSAPEPFWEDSLESLSPLSRDRLVIDNNLRSATGGADMRYQVVLLDSNLESLLIRSEQLNEVLGEARDEGLLENWQSVTQLLPSNETQLARQQRIPPPDRLANALMAAGDGLPFRPDAFGPFLQLADDSRDLPLITLDSYKGTPLGSWLDAHLLKLDDGWAALTFLVNPDTAALPGRLNTAMTGVKWTDLRESSTGVLRDFRGGAVRAMSVGAVLMLLLLLFNRFSLRRILWLLLSVGAALALTLALAALSHGKLTVIHLIALLLVFGLGLDYALFFSRDESRRERQDSLHAVAACAASTTLAFGILGGSSIPMLKFLGTTVAVGSAASFVLAYAGSRWFRRPVGPDRM
jgi:predicted exporter